MTSFFMTKNNITFGELIRQLRKEAGLTLTKLAAKLDLDSANLSKIENGKRDFDKKKLRQLSELFEVDLKELEKEFYSDLIAKKLYENDCGEEVLVLAEQKMIYLKNKNKARI